MKTSLTSSFMKTLALPAWPIWLLVVFMGSNSALYGQAHLANLIEDMNMVTRQMKLLQAEVEDLRKENTELKRQMKAQQNTYNDFVRTVQGQLNTIREQYEAADKRIVAETTRQIEDLAAQTQRALQALAQSGSAAPQPIRTPTFSDDFPETGIAYTVKPGDTLSQIARDHNSTVRWIQDANRIANPARDVRVGQNLFIPQKK